MTHTWEIHNLERQLSDGLILTASWYCKTELEGESQRTIGSVNLPYKNPSDVDFISYENLTQDIVLGWVTGSINTSTLYSDHSSSIADKINAINALTTGEGTPWK